jgi:hypothetical protein
MVAQEKRMMGEMSECHVGEKLRTGRWLFG